MGFYDLETARLDMYGKFALRTVESGGPVKGVQTNWMVFVQPSKVKGVFEVRRDNIPYARQCEDRTPARPPRLT